jgi:hypothetical protein
MYPQVLVQWHDSDQEKRILMDIHETWEAQPEFMDFCDVLLGSGDFFNEGTGNSRF